MKGTKYTAQEISDTASTFGVFASQHLRNMLVQAADTEVNLSKERKKCLKLCKDCARLAKENAEQKTRIDAVVKECEKIRKAKLDSWTDDINYKVHSVREEYDMIDSILRAARGE